jgi:transposase-like protein
MGPVRRQRWHLDEVLGTIMGVTPFLWRVVDPQGHVLESPVTKTRDVWQVSR